MLKNKLLNISLWLVFVSIAGYPFVVNTHYGDEAPFKSGITIGEDYLKSVYVDKNGVYKLCTNGDFSSYCIPEEKFKEYSYLTVKSRKIRSTKVYILKKNPQKDGEQVQYSNYYCQQVPVAKGVKLDILIPSDAKYIVIPYKSNDKIIKPVSINLCKTKDVSYIQTLPHITSSRDSSITSHRFVHWNIGHFSQGKYSHSTIIKKNYSIKYHAFKNFINNYCLDSHCLFNEYDETFANIDGVNISADTVLFDGKRSYAIFPRSVTFGYNKLAAFWKDGVIDYRYGVFESLKGVKNKKGMLEYGTGYCISQYAIGESDFYVMSFHAPPSISQEEYKALFIEILKICSKYRNVILVGDFNRHRIPDFELLTDAGFIILNDKRKTCPGGRCIFDWVLYRCKDVILSDFKVYTEAVDGNGDLLSDHLPLGFTVTKK